MSAQAEAAQTKEPELSPQEMAEQMKNQISGTLQLFGNIADGKIEGEDLLNGGLLDAGSLSALAPLGGLLMESDAIKQGIENNFPEIQNTVMAKIVDASVPAEENFLIKTINDMKVDELETLLKDNPELQSTLNEMLPIPGDVNAHMVKAAVANTPDLLLQQIQKPENQEKLRSAITPDLLNSVMEKNPEITMSMMTPMIADKIGGFLTGIMEKIPGLSAMFNFFIDFAESFAEQNGLGGVLKNLMEPDEEAPKPDAPTPEQLLAQEQERAARAAEANAGIPTPQNNG